ncbi:hypothetical protein BKA58DRAFT_457473 [Alternaria rosae]|uniref:uncharacterized protein n=1 Tax=Alternaria rosae TaxID=1187941 RepID=UPI001E8E4531|nr:uncharacterized protein BKA58DRAFT_457473 [Alternaria rosae]KAH6870123.1 hypothetical protein BKA58DRAFT_457473 [Alternaria rosae]
MSHQQNDDQTFQPSRGGSHSSGGWMFQAMHVAITELTSLHNELDAGSSNESSYGPPPAKIERYIVLSSSENLHGSECAICQEDYDDDQHVAIKLLGTGCSHVFGRNCLQDWVDSGMDNAHYCPSCRQSIHGALSVLPLWQLDAEEEGEDEQEEEEEEAMPVASMQEREEERDRQWAKVFEVSKLLQELETVLVPQVDAGNEASLASQVVLTQRAVQDEDHALRETVSNLTDQCVFLNELRRRA